MYSRLVAAARTTIHVMFKQADGELQDCMKQEELVPILLDLAMYENDDLVQGSLQLLDKIFSSELHLFRRAVQAQLLLTKESERLYKNISDHLHLLRQYLNPKILQYSESTPQSPLKKLTEKCWLADEAVGFEPHQQNQKIIYNFGECLK